MEKKDTINDLVFLEKRTFKVEKPGGGVLLETEDETVFLKKKEEAMNFEKDNPGADLGERIEKNEREGMRRIAALLDLKVEEVMGGNVSKLSRESGVSTVSIANLRKGEGMNPSLSVLVRIFTALNVSLEDILKPA